MLGSVGWMVLPPERDKFKHDTCEYDLIWKQGLCRCNQVKMRSYWSRVTLHPIWMMSLWEGTQTRRQWPCGISGRDHSATAGSQGTPRNAYKHQRLEGRTVSWSLHGEYGPASTWIWDPPASGFGTRSLQNRETINFCWSHPVYRTSSRQL